MEDIVVFLFLRVFRAFRAVEPQLKTISFRIYQHLYIIYPCSDKAFNGIVVNLELPSMQRGPLQITSTLSLKGVWIDIIFTFLIVPLKRLSNQL